MSNFNNLKSFIYNNSNKFIYLFVIVYLFIVTYFNYFSVQLFIWDDKDVIFRIEQIGYEEFFKDHNWSPRWLERYIWGLIYYLFQYEYSLYTLLFLIVHLLSTFFFYKILQFFFENKKFLFLVIIFYLTYGAHDVVNTKITFFPKTFYLLIFLVSLYTSFKAIKIQSKIKKASLVLLSALLIIFVHLSSFPYVFFAEAVRIFGITYLLFQSNKDISLNKIIINSLVYLVIFLALAVWIGFYENDFFGKVNINPDYDIKNYIGAFLNNPYDFLYSTFLSSKENLIKLILSPLFTFFSGINNYIENPASNLPVLDLSIKFCLYIFTITSLFYLLDKKGIFINNYSFKKLIITLFICILFIIIFLLLSSLTGRKVNFIFIGGLSRYAYPASLVYSLFVVTIIFLIFRNEKLRLLFFSLIITINSLNAFLGSQYYNKIENQTKEQIGQIIWRFGDFKNPTTFLLQDHKLSYATTLQKDKDHFLLDLLYDKSRGHLELKRFDNHLTNKDSSVPEFFVSIDNLKSNDKRKTIVGFKSQYQKCYEFYDENSSLNHDSAILYNLADPLDESNIDYSFQRSEIQYKNYLYYDYFNKMKILTDNQNELERNICYIYQTAKKYLAIKDYKNLALLSEKIILNVHYFEDFHNHGPEESINLYLWHPLIIGVLLYEGENKFKLLEKLKLIENQSIFYRFKIYYDEAVDFISKNNLRQS